MGRKFELKLDLSRGYKNEREKYLQGLINSLTPQQGDEVWLVAAGSKIDFIPVACFSNLEFAKLMTDYLGSAHYPMQVKVQETSLEVDQFVPYIIAAKRPYEIHMRVNGERLSAHFASTVEEPVLVDFEDYNSNSAFFILIPNGAVIGTFWGRDRNEAYVQAKLFVNCLILPIK